MGRGGRICISIKEKTMGKKSKTPIFPYLEKERKGPGTTKKGTMPTKKMHQLVNQSTKHPANDDSLLQIGRKK